MAKRKNNTGKGGITLILHNIRSAYNVGSLFRTADAAGVQRMYLCGYTPMPFVDEGLAGRAPSRAQKEIAKIALGAEKTMPWEYWAQAGRLIAELRQRTYQVIALEQTTKSKDIFSFVPQFPAALLVGNEVRGLSPALVRRCSVAVEIPMRGKKESLNVSVATGIALYVLSQES